MNWIIILLIALAIACFYIAYLHIKVRDLKAECDYLLECTPIRGKDGRYKKKK